MKKISTVFIASCLLFSSCAAKPETVISDDNPSDITTISFSESVVNTSSSIEATSGMSEKKIVAEQSESSDFNISTPSDNFIDGLKNVISGAKSVEELNIGLNAFDAENLIQEIRVYDGVGSFVDDVSMTEGALDYQQIIYINYDNGKIFITNYENQQVFWHTTMFSAIIARADTVEQLIAEIKGWDIECVLTDISVYASFKEASGTSGIDNPISVIMKNGQWLITEGDWNPVGAIRVTYDNGTSWFILHSKGDIV